MKHLLLILSTTFSLFITTPLIAKSTQQQKMVVCNQKASKLQLKGDSRKTFISNCLKSSKAKKSNSQHKRMKICNQRAKNKELKGEDRKEFMRRCLSK